MGWDEQAKTPLLNDPQQQFQQQPQQQGRKSESRGCNDILFAVLFVACCVGMLIISSVGFSKGDPKTLIPDWTNEVPVQGYFTNAVAQAKENKDALIISAIASVLLGFGWIQMMKMFTTQFV